MTTYKQPIRTIIADDHIVFRDGLKHVLEKTEDIKVIGEASNGKKLIELVLGLDPDVILVDLRMPVIDGIESIKRIKLLRNTVRPLILSSFDDEVLISEAIGAGSLDYITKTVDREQIINAVYAVFENRPYFCHTSKAVKNKLSGIYTAQCSTYAQKNPRRNAGVIFNPKPLKTAIYGLLENEEIFFGAGMLPGLVILQLFIFEIRNHLQNPA